MPPTIMYTGMCGSRGQSRTNSTPATRQHENQTLTMTTTLAIFITPILRGRVIYEQFQH